MNVWWHMSLLDRRQVIRHAAGSLAAFWACPFSSARSASTPASDPGTQPVRSFDVTAIQGLAAKIDGHLVTPNDEDYKSARFVFNRAFDRRPALILYCASESDVARGLEFAQRRNLPLAVRGGGHNRAGFSTCDDGVVIDLSGMNQVYVDARKRTARAQAGALVVHLDAATQRPVWQLHRQVARPLVLPV